MHVILSQKPTRQRPQNRDVKVLKTNGLNGRGSDKGMVLEASREIT